MYEEYKKAPDRFISSSSSIHSKEAFASSFSAELRDFNSAGVVAANQGIPLSKMHENTYEVYGESIQVSRDQRKLCRQTIEELVNRL
jgi:hypothetical protein